MTRSAPTAAGADPTPPGAEARPAGRGAGVASRVLKNSFFILVARGVQLVSSFLVVVIVARYLSLESYGEYSFLLAYVSSIMAFAYFGIQQVLIREIAKGALPPAAALGAAIELRTLLSLAATAVAIGSLLFMKLPPLAVAAGVIAVVSELLLSYSMLARSVFQAFERMIYEPVVTVVASVAVLAAVGGVVFLKLGFLWIFAALAIGNLAQFATSSFILSRRFVRPVFTKDREVFRCFLRDALVIGAGIFFYQNLFRINVVMLRWLGTLADVSRFTVPHNIVIQLQVIPLSLMMAVFPVFSRLMHTDAKKMAEVYGSVFRAMFACGMVFSLALFLYAGEIIETFFGARYADSAGVLMIVSWAMIPLTLDMLLNGVLIAMNKQKYGVVYAGAALAANVAFAVVFFPSHGRVGAAVAAVASYSVVCLCSMYFVGRNGISVGGAWAFVLRTAAAGCVTGVAVAAMKKFSLPGSVGGAMLVLPLSMYLFRAYTPADVRMLKGLLQGVRKGEAV